TSHTVRRLFALHHPLPAPSLPSFPTRRSSDLYPVLRQRRRGADHSVAYAIRSLAVESTVDIHTRHQRLSRRLFGVPHQGRSTARSEEHTSELQSHLNLVCRLLLEKKKQINNQT